MLQQRRRTGSLQETLFIMSSALRHHHGPSKWWQNLGGDWCNGEMALSQRASYISPADPSLRGERVYEKEGVRPGMGVRSNTLA